MSGLVELREIYKHSLPLRSKTGWMILLAILEVLVVSVRFDSGALVEGRGILRIITDQLPMLPQIFAVVFAATLVFGGRELADNLATVGDNSGKRAFSTYLSLHVIAFVLFMGMSVYFFDIDHGASAVGFALWVALAFATAATWLAVLVDYATWWAIARESAGPLLIGSCVGCAAWCAGQLSIGIWENLAFATFQSVYWILALVCNDVFQDVSALTIGTSEFSVIVAPECSGYEGMGLAVVFLATYLWWRRSEHVFPRSLLLIPMAIGLMFFVNSLRIAVLVLLGHFGAREVALGGFHSQAGWIGFNIVALGLVAFARWTTFFIRAGAQKNPEVAIAGEKFAIPMLSPFVVLTISIMLLGAIQTGFDWLYPIRFMVVALAVTVLYKNYPREIWQPSYQWEPVLIGVIVYFVWRSLESDDDGVANALYDSTRSVSPWMFTLWLVFRVLGSAITVPIAEEFAFRGYLLPWLSKDSQNWTWTGLLVSSIAFGVLHPGRWIAGTIAGVLYGIAFYRHRKLMDAVIAHSITNAMIAIEAMIWSRWYLWG